MGPKAIRLLRWAMQVNDWCIITTTDRNELNAINTLVQHRLIVTNVERTKYKVNLGD